MAEMITTPVASPESFDSLYLEIRFAIISKIEMAIDELLEKIPKLADGKEQKKSLPDFFKSARREIALYYLETTDRDAKDEILAVSASFEEAIELCERYRITAMMLPRYWSRVQD